jgi:hypothetical protein
MEKMSPRGDAVTLPNIVLADYEARNGFSQRELPGMVLFERQMSR